MKNSLYLFTSLLILGVHLKGSAQAAEDDILGVYKYQSDLFEGMSIITPKHFIWIISNKDRPVFADAEPTLAEKARAFEALNIGAGTWVSTGNRRNKVTYTQHVNPDLIGTSFEYEYAFEGDQAKYWIIGADGSRGPVNYSRKVATWNAPGSCSLYNGVWEYEDLGESALYVQTGNYGAWIILDEIVSDVSTDEGKARAFDVLNASFVMGDCQDGNKDFWHVLYSGNLRDEKTVIGGRSNKLKAGHYRFQILNAKGEPVGDGFTVRRIEK